MISSCFMIYDVMFSALLSYHQILEDNKEQWKQPVISRGYGSSLKSSQTNNPVFILDLFASMWCLVRVLSCYRVIHVHSFSIYIWVYFMKFLYLLHDLFYRSIMLIIPFYSLLSCPFPPITFNYLILLFLYTTAFYLSLLESVPCNCSSLISRPLWLLHIK